MSYVCVFVSHSNEMVETVICGIYGESPYDVLVTTVDGQCTHEKVVYSFTPCFPTPEAA